MRMRLVRSILSDVQLSGRLVSCSMFNAGMFVWDVAVAAHLAEYKFNLKTDPPSRFKPGSKVDKEITFEPLERSKEWDRGVVYAEAQNLARTVRSIHFLDIILAAQRADQKCS